MTFPPDFMAHTALARRAGVLAGMLALVVGAASSRATEAPALERVVASIDAGQFASADRLIAATVADPRTNATARNALLFQRERMQRIRADFTLDAADVKASVKAKIPDLTDDEFAHWDNDGLFERQVIDGSLRYFNRSPGNLFRLSGEARARRREQTPFVDSPMETANAHHRHIVQSALQSGQQSVEPHRVRITQSLTVDANAVPAGATVRAWIPYPRSLPGQQEDIQILSSAPESHDIAPESVMQRTVYMQQEAVVDRPTAFSVSYELTIYGRYQAVDPERVVAAPVTSELAPYVAERPPHITFNAAIRLFSEQVVGEETNPWRIAQKLYTAVDKIPWAGAREYSTITNISDYALHAGHADCGQQTLLLMTLMRLNGIPTRWQSGLMFSAGDYWNLHDWAQLYIAPYGWLPMDVTFGRFDSETGLEWFYLGGLDAFRIAFNDDFGTSFVPAKQSFRSETVDSQRGEAEWDGGNLYFDQWSYAFHAEVLPDVPTAAVGKRTIATSTDISRRGT